MESYVFWMFISMAFVIRAHRQYAFYSGESSVLISNLNKVFDISVTKLQGAPC